MLRFPHYRLFSFSVLDIPRVTNRHTGRHSSKFKCGSDLFQASFRVVYSHS
jgi:hypothetical protein